MFRPATHMLRDPVDTLGNLAARDFMRALGEDLMIDGACANRHPRVGGKFDEFRPRHA